MFLQLNVLHWESVKPLPSEKSGTSATTPHLKLAIVQVADQLLPVLPILLFCPPRVTIDNWQWKLKRISESRRLSRLCPSKHLCTGPTSLSLDKERNVKSAVFVNIVEVKVWKKHYKKHPQPPTRQNPDECSLIQRVSDFIISSSQTDQLQHIHNISWQFSYSAPNPYNAENLLHQTAKEDSFLGFCFGPLVFFLN